MRCCKTGVRNLNFAMPGLFTPAVDAFVAACGRVRIYQLYGFFMLLLAHNYLDKDHRK